MSGSIVSMGPLMAVSNIFNHGKQSPVEFKEHERSRLESLDMHVVDIFEYQEIKFEEGERVVVSHGQSCCFCDGRILRIDYLQSDDEIGDTSFHIRSGDYDVICKNGSVMEGVSWRRLHKDTFNFNKTGSKSTNAGYHPRTFTALVIPNRYMTTKIVIAENICRPSGDYKSYPKSSRIRILEEIIHSHGNEFYSNILPKSSISSNSEGFGCFVLSSNKDLLIVDNPNKHHDSGHETSDEYDGSIYSMCLKHLNFNLLWIMSLASFSLQYFRGTIHKDVDAGERWGGINPICFLFFTAIWSILCTERWRMHVNSRLLRRSGLFYEQKTTCSQGLQQKYASIPQSFFTFGSLGVNWIVFGISVTLVIGLALYFIPDMGMVLRSQRTPMELTLNRYYTLLKYMIVTSCLECLIDLMVTILSPLYKIEDYGVLCRFILGAINAFVVPFYFLFVTPNTQVFQEALFPLITLKAVVPILSTSFVISEYSGIENLFPKCRTNFVEDDMIFLLLCYGYIVIFLTVQPLLLVIIWVTIFFRPQILIALVQKYRGVDNKEAPVTIVLSQFLEFISLPGFVTNSHFVVKDMKSAHNLLSSFLHEFIAARFGKYDIVTLMITIGYVLYVLKLIVKSFSEMTPFHICQLSAVNSVCKSIRGSLERVESICKSSIFSEFSEKSTSKSNSDRKARAKMSRQFPQNFSSDPSQYLALFGVLSSMRYCQHPLSWLSVPLVLGYLTFLQICKMKVAMKNEMWIVYDTNIVEYIARDFPSWISESEAQKCGWFNGIISRLWPYLSDAINEKSKTTLNPRLKRDIKFAGIGKLARMHVDRFVLGSISPKVRSIRVHDTFESVVRIDFETVWSSDMEMVMIMELCEMIQIPLKINFCSSSLFLRVELAKFTEIIPCVNDLSISLMRGPHIDFSFHIGSLAFTNLGLGHYNLANFGRSCLSEFLCDNILYPKTFNYVLGKKSSSICRHPVGLLQISIGGTNDVVLDDCISDPFILVNTRTVLPQSAEHNKIMKEGNIQLRLRNFDSFFCEELSVLIYEKASEIVEVCIVDYEPLSSNAELEIINIELCHIPIKRWFELEMNFGLGPGGKMKLKYVYFPLLRSSQKAETFDEDEALLVNVPNFLKIKNSTSYICSVGRKTHSFSRADFVDNGGTWRDVGDRNGKSSSLCSSASMGVLVVSSVRCKNLRALPSLIDLFIPSRMKVYVNFEVNEVIHTTKMVADKHDPTFPGEFNFVVADLNYSKLSITVIDTADVFSCRILGSINLNVKDFVNSSGVENEYLLEGKYEECFVIFKCSLYVGF